MSFHMYDTYKSPVHCHEGDHLLVGQTFLALHSHLSPVHRLYRRERKLLHAPANVQLPSKCRLHGYKFLLFNWQLKKATSFIFEHKIITSLLSSKLRELNVTMHLRRLYTPYLTDIASYKTQWLWAWGWEIFVMRNVVNISYIYLWYQYCLSNSITPRISDLKGIFYIMIHSI